MNQWAREHPELADKGLDYFTANTDLVDMRDGPKPACPHCGLRSCYLGVECCDASREAAARPYPPKEQR